jgi:glutathione S-transferase
MTKPILYIGNRNYSSWSLRPHMALAMAGIAFDEKLIRFGEPAFSRAVRRISKAGLVPILEHNGLKIWDTLGIMEYAAETWPGKNLWPKNKAARAMARSLAAEMHSGFRNLRTDCPMNLRWGPKPYPVSEAVMKEVARMEQSFFTAQKAFGKGGPFLFGQFCITDAMFTPLLSRLETYCVPVSARTRAYMKAVLSTAAFKQWKDLALKERWTVPEDEVAEIPAR